MKIINHKINHRSILKLLSVILITIMLLIFSGRTLNAIQAQPELSEANEVVYDEASTISVADAQGFLDAYKNTSISKIVFTSDIDVSTAAITINGFRSTLLNRSLVIDGQGHTLTAALTNGPNDYTFFRLNSTTGATFHLKNLTFIAGGQNLIDDENYFVRSTNWQVIIDNVSFPKDTSTSGNTPKKREPNRVLRMRNGHLFLRNKVEMYTNAENMYIGEITVEKNADVYGEINHFDFSTWWFVDYNSKGMMNIGENAKVSLNGIGGVSYPTVYQHFRTINVHKNADFNTRKPGNALRFDATSGVSDKYINIYQGATLDAASTGNGANSIISTLGTGFAGHVIAAPKANIFLIGTSANDTTPLVNLPNAASSFELHQPEKYDLRNNRTSGYVVKVGTNANFKIIDSDIEVWKKGIGVNLDIKPTHSWFLANVIADSNGNPILGTDEDVAKVWKTNDYARLTALNTNPTLKIREITDADKNFTIEAYVLNVLAWADQVTINVTDDKSSTKYNGNNDANGLYKFSSSDFYKAGTKISASGYRGDERWATLDPQATTIVKDVTPPKPAQIKSKILSGAKQLSGTTDEPGSTVTISLNGEMIKDGEEIIKTVADNSGKWTIVFPESFKMNEKDILQVYLSDSEGNTNPKVDTNYKDAIFLAGSKIEVISVITPPVDEESEAGQVDAESGLGIWVKPTRLTFENLKASSKAQSSVVQGSKDRLISVVDISESDTKWQLEARMTTPVSTSSLEEKLVGSTISWISKPGIHNNPKTSLELSDSDNVIAPENIKLNKDNQKILNIVDGTISGYYGLLMKDLKLDILGNTGRKNHNYNSTITWSLNDVPTID